MFAASDSDPAAQQPPALVQLELPAAVLEAIAARAAELALQRLALDAAACSPYMTIPEAAAHARCKRQRIDDLLSSGRLTRHKDGSRTLVARAELEARLNRGQPMSARATGSTPSRARENRQLDGCELSRGDRATVADVASCDRETP